MGFDFSWWSVVWAIVGAFGTAYMHQTTGRDPRWGGLIGLVCGYLLGIISLLMLWGWLYYNRNTPHVIRTYRRWYEWWRP